MNTSEQAFGHGKPRLLDRVREAIRARHYRFVLFHKKRHPAEMGHEQIAQFLSSLAVDRKVSASTQNQALNAVLFLYREVLNQKIPWLPCTVQLTRA